MIICCRAASSSRLHCRGTWCRGAGSNGEEGKQESLTKLALKAVDHEKCDLHARSPATIQVRMCGTPTASRRCNWHNILNTNKACIGIRLLVVVCALAMAMGFRELPHSPFAQVASRRSCMSSPWTTLVGHVSKRESRFDRVVQSCFAQVAGLSGSLTDRFAETPAACYLLPVLSTIHEAKF